MIIPDLNGMRVYVSEEEWERLSPEAKLELIALSRMTGEDVTDNLTDEEKELYERLSYE